MPAMPRAAATVQRSDGSALDASTETRTRRLSSAVSTPVALQKQASDPKASLATTAMEYQNAVEAGKFSPVSPVPGVYSSGRDRI